MKIKPILIGAAGVLLLAAVFFYLRSKNSVKPEKAGINQFLNGFNNRINEGDTNSLLPF